MSLQKEERLYYFSDSLRHKLKNLIHYPCTVVEAPIGYGKTTSVREALKALGKKGFWVSLYSNSREEFWKAVVRVAAKMDEDFGKKIGRIEHLEGSLMRQELVEIVDSLLLTDDIFLVIDDYHHLNSNEIDYFLKLLISVLPEKMHLILITRAAFSGNTEEMRLKRQICAIGSNDLALSITDIRNYFRLMGISLNREEAQKLYDYSEGWISALYLCALDYRRLGTVTLSRSVPELVYQTVYEPLEEEQKNFLLYLCQLEEFSHKQADIVWKKENTHILLEQLIQKNTFMIQNELTGNYVMHNILRMCLLEQFSHLHREKKITIWKRIAQSFFESRLYPMAMQYYYYARDFENAMCAMETGHFESTLQYEQKDLMVRCYRECPEEIKWKHPEVSLLVALLMITLFMDMEVYEEARRDFGRCMEENHSLGTEERNQLLGEYEILQMLSSYNDLPEMSRCSERAAGYLNKPVHFYVTKNCFLFDAPSVLFHYYRETGKLEELVIFARNMAGHYANHSDGHGKGYQSLLEAEWRFETGDTDSAEIMLYHSMLLAEQFEQHDVLLAGMFLFARIYLFRGEYRQLVSMMQKMEELVRREISISQSYSILYTLGLCKTAIYLVLEQSEQVPSWILEHTYPRYLQFLSIPYANMVYGNALLQKKENHRLLGLSEIFLQEASRFPNLMAVIQVYLQMAIVNYRVSRMEDAGNALRKALEIAVPDGLIMPFVEKGKDLAAMYTLILEEHEYHAFLKKVHLFYEQFVSSVSRISAECSDRKKTELTPREKQIALLVVEGRRNKEIATELSISPETVKAELKNIFRKKEIDSRALLTEEMIE